VSCCRFHGQRVKVDDGTGGRRRRFDRAFKLEAVRLVRERSVSAAQAARDLGVHENVLRKRVKEFAADPQHAFPGQSR